MSRINLEDELAGAARVIRHGKCIHDGGPIYECESCTRREIQIYATTYYGVTRHGSRRRASEGGKPDGCGCNPKDWANPTRIPAICGAYEAHRFHDGEELYGKCEHEEACHKAVK